MTSTTPSLPVILTVLMSSTHFDFDGRGVWLNVVIFILSYNIQNRSAEINKQINCILKRAAPIRLPKGLHFAATIVRLNISHEVKLSEKDAKVLG